MNHHIGLGGDALDECAVAVLFVNTTHNIADCSLAGPGGQGAACLTGAALDDKKCAADFLCTTVGTTACRRICNPTLSPTGCLAGQTCLSFATALRIPAVGGVEYGVCN